MNKTLSKPKSMGEGMNEKLTSAKESCCAFRPNVGLSNTIRLQCDWCVTKVKFSKKTNVFSHLHCYVPKISHYPFNLL